MAGSKWSETVAIAVRRLVARTGSARFTRQQMIEEELARIVNETGSRGATPDMTLSRELQQLRDRGEIDFIGTGIYQLRDAPVGVPAVAGSHCVFVVGSHSIHEAKPDRFCRIQPSLLTEAARSIGRWIIYQEPRSAGNRGYYAAARVEQIIRDPSDKRRFLALIEPGTYLEFGRDVALQHDGSVRERGLLDPNGGLDHQRAAWPVRAITEEDFDRIISLGLIEEDELLPREESVVSSLDRVQDIQTQEPLLGPIDRATMLVERKVRDRQFRKRVLDAYGSCCALTGMRLVNGGGRAEAEAAHIMSVKAGGPDTVANGIALSGTIHWMFDRGLLSLSDTGDILMSRKIHEVEGVQKLIYSDRRARLPSNEARPSPRYLEWHREVHGFAA